MRKRAGKEIVNEMAKQVMKVMADVSADSGEVLTDLHTKETDQPGAQYEQHIQKARSIQAIAIDIQGKVRQLQKALEREEQLHNPAGLTEETLSDRASAAATTPPAS